MRNRNNRVVICFSDKELERLNKAVAQTCMSREAYIRSFMEGRTPVAMPSKDYFRLAKEMRAAGNTLNRIAAQMYASKVFDAPAYQRAAKRVLQTADEMHVALAPGRECVRKTVISESV